LGGTGWSEEGLGAFRGFVEQWNLPVIASFRHQDFGALSDHIGRRMSMILFGILTTVGSVPLLYALRLVKSPYAAFGLVMIALAIVSLYTSISGLIKAEMFPPEVRALGVGSSYAIANAIFGGSAEYVALWLKSVGSEPMFYWYVTVLCAIAGIFALCMREPSKEGFLRGNS
jgi:MHS family alpha-ketoglutarate permease-like MFS transporter